MGQTFSADTGSELAMSTWPDAVRALAGPLYARGLPVYCLPYYGSWLWAPLTAETDLTATLSTGEFIRMMCRRPHRGDGGPQCPPQLRRGLRAWWHAHAHALACAAPQRPPLH